MRAPKAFEEWQKHLPAPPAGGCTGFTGSTPGTALPTLLLCFPHCGSSRAQKVGLEQAEYRGWSVPAPHCWNGEFEDEFLQE